MDGTGHSNLPADQYERGLTLKKAGHYKSALAQFESVAADPAFALRAHAQSGLCLRAIGRLDDAVTAFKKALALTGTSTKDTVQLLYVLGRTLEALGRIAESLEAYRWLRREDAGYRDVADRIEHLSAHRASPAAKKPAHTSESVTDQTSKI